MEIIKSKRDGSICNICHKPIDNKYKVDISGGWEKTTHSYFHLSCYLRRLKIKLENTKKEIKKFSKTKFKKVRILENLE